ncbi:precorrin-8X methylmutase [Anaerobacillus sp. MEB173]|uniref:precorrin-8X methylmutase n=1 Tax=Anaerobacillus sp. MEB173 TaxID=3383345 RepID=UPI003F91F804
MDFLTEFKPTTIHPEEIEQLSHQTVTNELGVHSFTADQYPVVQRVIYASADFELGKSMLFHEEAIEAGIRAIRAGEKIICDVHMVQVGISKPRIEKFGGSVHVHITDEDVAKKAKELQITRAIMATRKAVRETAGGIYVIGNAPTALLELIRLIKLGEARPSLIVGVPVGFVSTVESKEELAKLDVPYITNVGRKGGSPVAVSIVNALAILAEKLGER